MGIRLLALSDSHLFESEDTNLFEVKTFHSLELITSDIRQHGEQFDLMVVTGDISEDGSKRSYQHFQRLSEDLAENTIWFEGNHDQFSNVPDELAKKCIFKTWHVDEWSFIFLATKVSGRDEGVLSKKELQRLESFLQEYSEKHVLIFMHHQPVDVESQFIDELGLENKREFWALTSHHKNIKGILFGHVHQVYDNQHNGIRVISNPSTSMQFTPFSPELDFDAHTHGYRTITLNPDGSMDTNVHLVRSAK